MTVKLTCVTGYGGSSLQHYGASSIWIDHSKTWHKVSKQVLFWALYVCRHNTRFPKYLVRPDLESHQCPICARPWDHYNMPPCGGWPRGTFRKSGSGGTFRKVVVVVVVVLVVVVVVVVIVVVVVVVVMVLVAIEGEQTSSI